MMPNFVATATDPPRPRADLEILFDDRLSIINY